MFTYVTWGCGVHVCHLGVWCGVHVCHLGVWCSHVTWGCGVHICHLGVWYSHMSPGGVVFTCHLGVWLGVSQIWLLVGIFFLQYQGRPQTISSSVQLVPVLDSILKKKAFDPKKIKLFVLDEADVMIAQQGQQDQTVRIQK